MQDATNPEAPPRRRRILAAVLAVVAAVGGVLVLVFDRLANGSTGG
jgi:hypothetical protein